MAAVRPVPRAEVIRAIPPVIRRAAPLAVAAAAAEDIRGGGEKVNVLRIQIKSNFNKQICHECNRKFF